MQYCENKEQPGLAWKEKIMVGRTKGEKLPTISIEFRSVKGSDMTNINQFRVMHKLKDLLRCKDYSAMARVVGIAASSISRMRSGKERLTPKLLLNAGTILDISPRRLLREVGLPEYYFLDRKGK